MTRAGTAPSWAALVGITAMLTLSLRAAHMPAALMLGPMLAGIAVAILRPGPALPRTAAVVAQAVLGCLIAQALSPRLLVDLAPQWPILLGMNLALMLGTLAMGAVATKTGWLPGTAGIWGMSPGGAAAMVMLSEAYGSDKRLVAIMQYLRLVCATLGVVALGSLIGTPHVGAPVVGLPGATGTAWLGPITPLPTAITLGLTGAGVAATLMLRQATLVIFVPVFGGIAVQAAGLPAPEVPPLLSAAAFAVIGWHVGLSFTRAALRHSARLLPKVLAGIGAILLYCAGLSLLLAKLAQVSFLTAYMALNPGGADVVMIMGASVAIDLPLVMAMQISRLILVITLSPVFGRLAAAAHLRSKAKADGSAERLADDVDRIA